MPVSAVSGGDHVRLVQNHGNGGGDCLLPNARVRRPMNQPRILKVEDNGLEFPDKVEQKQDAH